LRKGERKSGEGGKEGRHFWGLGKRKGDRERNREREREIGCVWYIYIYIYIYIERERERKDEGEIDIWIGIAIAAKRGWPPDTIIKNADKTYGRSKLNQLLIHLEPKYNWYIMPHYC
jgi:hypothetical protein